MAEDGEDWNGLEMTILKSLANFFKMHERWCSSFNFIRNTHTNRTQHTNNNNKVHWKFIYDNINYCFGKKKTQWGNKYHLTTITEPAVFVPEVARQPDEFVRAIAFAVLVSARACFWLDEITRKLVEWLNEDFSNPELAPTTVQGKKQFFTNVKIYIEKGNLV